MTTTFPTIERSSAVPTVERSRAARPIVTKIIGKFQITVPPEIREIYGLLEGDLLEWNFNAQTSQLVICPKRAQLLTPQVEKEIFETKARRAKEKQRPQAALAY
jgi:bifunctional DNA-binding transcriptional regulator/antitoxin component of YhaV-PrlF toxin-antitoxin module